MSSSPTPHTATGATPTLSPTRPLSVSGTPGTWPHDQSQQAPPGSALLPPSPGYTETLQSPVGSSFTQHDGSSRQNGFEDGQQATAGPGPSSMLNGRTSSLSRAYSREYVIDDDDELGVDEAEQEDVCAFTLLAEFDIDAGATMAYQYPYPTGTDEHRLAELMLPDGVHMRGDDSTFFYLGQHPSTSIASLLASDPTPSSSPTQQSIDFDRQHDGAKPTPGSGSATGAPLLYVMNCVRCQMNKEVKRGAEVKAMAIASPVPWLEVWRPILVWYLGEYFKTPDFKILQDLYELCNSLVMPAVPRFTRTEKIILRQEDRLDALAEVYDGKQEAQMRSLRRRRDPAYALAMAQRRSVLGLTSPPQMDSSQMKDDPAGVRSEEGSSDTAGMASPEPNGGGAGAAKGTWKTPESDSADRLVSNKASYPSAAAPNTKPAAGLAGRNGIASAAMETSPSGTDQEVYNGIRLVVSKGNPARDTRFVEMRKRIDRLGETPFRVPTNAFDEDVGGYSLVRFVNMLKDHAPFPAPYYPHLHTSGATTPPVILIINALLANHRVIFYSAGAAAPACQAVLSACALASGCGQVIRGITDIAFPYANLSMVEIMEDLQGYIVGVNNPRFEELPMLWDVYVDVERGSVRVNKNIQAPSVRASVPPAPAGSDNPAGSLRSGRSSDTSLSGSIATTAYDPHVAGPTAKAVLAAKGEGSDHAFMEEVMVGLENHLGENFLRRRFTDWLQRFVTLAAHHEYTTTGSTKIGYPSVPYKSGTGGLGSGAVFADEAAKQREMALNAPRIEAWRKTKGYRLFVKDWAQENKTRALPFDAAHQFAKLRIVKNMSDEELDAIYIVLARYTRQYEHVVELLAAWPSKKGGLQVIANGLFHRYPGVRESAAEILVNLQAFEIGRQMIAGLSYYHRTAFMRAIS